MCKSKILLNVKSMSKKTGDNVELVFVEIDKLKDEILSCVVPPSKCIRRVTSALLKSRQSL